MPSEHVRAWGSWGLRRPAPSYGWAPVAQRDGVALLKSHSSLYIFLWHPSLSACFSFMCMCMTLSFLTPGVSPGFTFPSLAASRSCTKRKLIKYRLTCLGVSRHLKLEPRIPDPGHAFSAGSSSSEVQYEGHPAVSVSPSSHNRAALPWWICSLSSPAYKEQLLRVLTKWLFDTQQIWGVALNQSTDFTPRLSGFGSWFCRFGLHDLQQVASPLCDSVSPSIKY